MHGWCIVGMSALLTMMAQMKPTIEALEEAGLRESVKFMIGGAGEGKERAAYRGRRVCLGRRECRGPRM